MCVLPTLCFANCERGCSVGIAATGKWSYVMGELTPEHAADLLAMPRPTPRRRPGRVAIRPSRLSANERDRPLPRRLNQPRTPPNDQRCPHPATIITGFLGAGKTTLLRHLLETARGKRLAIIVNEFGSVGVDGEMLRSCGIKSCPEENIVELSNGCLCCTVAEDFIPTMQALIDRDTPPEHILIETSGLALR
jgi:hypothetical protein